MIPHRPERTFTVVTADARVIDIGTVFSVAVQPSPSGPKTLVEVEEGEVLVQYAGGERRIAATQRPRETLGVETQLLRDGLASERKGDLRAAEAAFETLVRRYPESPLVRDARAALARVKGRLEASP